MTIFGNEPTACCVGVGVGVFPDVAVVGVVAVLDVVGVGDASESFLLASGDVDVDVDDVVIVGTTWPLLSAVSSTNVLFVWMLLSLLLLSLLLRVVGKPWQRT